MTESTRPWSTRPIAGRALVQPADALTSAADSEPGADVFRVGVVGASLNAVDWRTVRLEWQSRWPGTRLVYVPLDATNQESAILDSDVDIAFKRIVDDEDQALETHVILSSPRAVVVPRGWAAADARSLTPQDIPDPADWIFADGGSERYNRWTQGLPHVDSPRDVVIRQAEQVAQAVEFMDRCCVHSMIAKEAYETPAVAFVPLPGPSAEIGVAIRRADQRPALRTLYQPAKRSHGDVAPAPERGTR
ncbi:LysR substrate-binding domain-containing protein [Nocardiopsis sediminis]|uniref:LysR substrate-binding domain-containing protein n=1 Tax=Nocardiopsis sediminis TaxID=1778267 RepID=A0ABV8FML7_9ACTN